MGNQIDEETLLVTALIAACGFGYFYFKDEASAMDIGDDPSEGGSEEVQIVKPKSLTAIKEHPERQWDVEVMELDSDLAAIIKRKDAHGWSHLMVGELDALLKEAIALGNAMRIANPMLPSGDTIPKMLMNITKDLRNTAERARVTLAVSSVSLSDESTARLGEINKHNRHKQDSVVKTEPVSAHKGWGESKVFGAAQETESSGSAEKRASSEVSVDPGAVVLAPKKVPENAFTQGESDSIQIADQNHNAQALNDGETQIIPKDPETKAVIADTNIEVPDENEQRFSQPEGKAAAKKRARDSLEEAEEGVKASGFIQGKEVHHDNVDEPPNKKQKPTPHGTPLPSSAGTTYSGDVDLDFLQLQEPKKKATTKEEIIREIERILGANPPFSQETKIAVEALITQLDKMWPHASVSMQQKAQWRTRLDRKPRVIKRPNTDTALP